MSHVIYIYNEYAWGTKLGFRKQQIYDENKILDKFEYYWWYNER